MPISNDRSPLTARTPQDWRVASKPTANAGKTSATGKAPSDVVGQVGGSPQRAPSLSGRVAPAPVDASGSSSTAGAVRRSTNAMNSMINKIESTRRPDGTLTPRAAAALTQLDHIASACDLTTGGPAVGETLIDQIRSLNDLANGDGKSASILAAGMQAIEKAPAEQGDHVLDSVVGQLAAWTDEAAAQAQDRMNYLSQSLGSSALNVSKLYETKASINDAAVAVLDAAIAQHPEKKDILERGKGKFVARGNRLRDVAQEREGEIGRVKDFAGTKKVTGFFGNLFSPLKARAERSAREQCVEQLLTGNVAGNIDALGTSEMSVVEDALAAILKDAKVTGPDAHQEVEHAFLDILDRNAAWSQPVTKQIQIPVMPQSTQHNFEQLSKDLVDGAVYSSQQAFEAVADFSTAPDSSRFAAETLQVKSEITPAPALLSSYDGKGVNAHRSAEGTHAANLAHTTLTDAAGKTLFSGVRHGVLSAYAITEKGADHIPNHELEKLMHDLLPTSKHPYQYTKKEAYDSQATMKKLRNSPALLDEMRAKANQNRTSEVVAMTVMGDPKLRAAALAGETPTVDILSLSLLTPDAFRRGESDNESLMLLDQVKAWDKMTGTREIQIPNDAGELVKVDVKINPVAMNYGVNQGAVGTPGQVSDLISGWPVADTLNDESLQTLFGKDLSKIGASKDGLFGKRIEQLAHENRMAVLAVEDKINTVNLSIANLQPDMDLDALQQDRLDLLAQKKQLESIPSDQSTPLGAALELARQIDQIRGENAHRKAGTEPYKMPTRLAVLGDLLGVKIAFNCKSGKDRTGDLDSEIKHFKLQMQTTGTVPHYKRERTETEKRQFHEVVTNSGNFEMQQLNTGFTGYKLKGVGAVYRQFGGNGKDALTENFHGFSDQTAT